MHPAPLVSHPTLQHPRSPPLSYIDDCGRHTDEDAASATSVDPVESVESFEPDRVAADPLDLRKRSLVNRKPCDEQEQRRGGHHTSAEADGVRGPRGLFGGGAGSEEFAEDWRTEELAEALKDWGRGVSAERRGVSAHTWTGRRGC